MLIETFNERLSYHSILTEVLGILCLKISAVNVLWFI